MHLYLCWLQSCRCSGHIASHVQNSCRLQGHAASPWFRLQVQLPTPHGGLFHAARDRRKRKRPLFVLQLEIDSTVVKLDFLQIIGWPADLLRPGDSP